MIEVLALAGTVTKIAGSISAAVKAGRDISDLLPHFGKLAKLEADISLAEQGRHKGPLGRLTSSEEEGFAIAQAKMKHKEAQNELREVCRLYGPPGIRDRLFWGLSVALGVVIFVVGFAAMVLGLNEVVNG
jgi:hypothetical protein